MPLASTGSAGSFRNHAAIGAWLAALTSLGLFLLHPRLAIRDLDGYGYIQGARSLREGLGYRSLTGEPFNHWPPGYSLLLSAFPDPMTAALLVNYLSCGVVAGLLYCLLRRSGWSWQAGLGLSVVLASGFFRQLANVVHNETVTYALFLLALWVALRGPGRTLAGVVWALMVPIKFIALTFLPPALAADIITGRTLKGLARTYTVAIVVTGLSAGGVFAFNALTTVELVPSSHLVSKPGQMTGGAREFIASIPRMFLFGWQGSVREPAPKAAFLVTMVLAGICLLSLRPITTPSGRWLRIYGISFLVCVFALLWFRAFGPTARITGYGLIALLLSFRPMKWADGVWLLYGGLALGVAVWDASTTPSLGLNDPRYVDLAHEVRASDNGSAIVATNSAHLLDLHAGIPSVRIMTEADARPYQKLLWVTMPNVDGTVAITPMPRPGSEWCEAQHFSGAVLFVRCE